MELSTSNLVTGARLQRRACGMCSWMKKKCEPLVRSDGNQICRRCQTKNLSSCPAIPDRSKPKETAKMVEGVISHLISCKSVKATPARSVHSAPLTIGQNEIRNGDSSPAIPPPFQVSTVPGLGVRNEMPASSLAYIPSDYSSRAVRQYEQIPSNEGSFSQANASPVGIGYIANSPKAPLDIDAFIASVIKRHTTIPEDLAPFGFEYQLPDIFPTRSVYQADLLPNLEGIRPSTHPGTTASHWQDLRPTYPQATAAVHEGILTRDGLGRTIEYGMHNNAADSVNGAHDVLSQIYHAASGPSDLLDSMPAVNAPGDLCGKLTAPPYNQNFQTAPSGYRRYS